MKVILAIDPGTHCGWAVRSSDGTLIASGVWDLSVKRGEGGGMRILRLHNHLTETIEIAKPDLVAYELVLKHLGTDAAHVYGAIVGKITEVCERAGIQYVAIGVGAIKKTATGKGNADKHAMIHAAEKKWGRTFETSDEADACWLAEAAVEHLPR